MGCAGKRRVPRGAQVLLITWALKWFGFLGFFGMRPYLNLLQLCASAMGKLGSLKEEKKSLAEARSNSRPLFRLVRNCSAKPRAVTPW